VPYEPFKAKDSTFIALAVGNDRQGLDSGLPGLAPPVKLIDPDIFFQQPYCCMEKISEERRLNNQNRLKSFW